MYRQMLIVGSHVELICTESSRAEETPATDGCNDQTTPRSAAASSFPSQAVDARSECDQSHCAFKVVIVLLARLGILLPGPLLIRDLLSHRIAIFLSLMPLRPVASGLQISPCQRRDDGPLL